VIDPELAAFVEAMPVIDLSDPVAARAGFEELLVAIRSDLPEAEGMTIEDRLAPGWQGDPDVAVRVYRPYAAPGARLPGIVQIHGGGFIVIALATVILAPFMEELFFRGLLFKALVRLLTPLRAAGGARVAGVVAAVVLDGLLFGLAHGEWIQLAGLAVFGMALAAVSYRTGRLGMNMVAHATFNLVAIVAIASNGNALIH